ncbi:hypothetical protein [Thioalbus denitrificans]|uniref:hypothetical protein n=1 Tax=Thioalbus denitrificans TaxID=547122 RepID=UPI0011C0834D|nr:hypothetical protein [Thioalbus denitrificans]
MYRLAVGEHFAYAFTNAGDEEIEDVSAAVPGHGEVYGQAGMSGHSKAFHLINVWAEEGRRVPEVLQVRWRKLPEPGGKPYTGKPVGPYTVKVRERIPPEILKQVHSSADLQLRLIFAIQNQGVDFRWELREYGWEVIGTKLLRSGE